MNTIGFQNFRGFQNFPEMNLGDITLLVGGNNSGKSTLVKALLLCIDNIRLMKGKENSNSIFTTMLPKFRFDANAWHDVKIKTFERALYNQAAEGSEIRFVFTLGCFRFDINIACDGNENEVTGMVTSLSIEDRVYQVKYDVDYMSQVMKYTVIGSASKEESLTERLYRDYISAQKELAALSDAGENISAISAQGEKVASLEKRIEELVNPDGIELPEDFDYEQSLKQLITETSGSNHTSATTWELPVWEEYITAAPENLLLHAIGNFIEFANNPGEAEPTDAADSKKHQEWKRVSDVRAALRLETDKMRKSQNTLRMLLDDLCVEYITAHAANQNTLYNTADRNDYNAQTVHEFMRAKITKDDKEYKFVTDWMQKLGIGCNFEITSLDGEAYRVEMIDEDVPPVNLADKGMGSIQAMILLLRIATILRERQPRYIVAKNDNARMRYPLIIIEEPEQNLHPKLQSLLADFFYELNQKYHLRFLVETHSEYLIRKSQVIVANEDYANENELKEANPFKVYYFPGKGEQPYDMEYTPSGSFNNKFGEGFFDEAANLDMTIIRKEFELKKKNRK